MFIEILKNGLLSPKFKFRCENSEKTVILQHKAEISVSQNDGELEGAKFDFSFDGGNGSRSIISAGNDVLFVLDSFNYEQSSSEHSYFDFPISKDFNINVADKTRLVMRAGGKGMKWFKLLSQTDSEDTLGSCGLLLPAAFPDNNTIEISQYGGLYNYGTSQKSMYVFVEKASNEIGGWHIKKNEDGFGIHNIGDALQYTADFRDGDFTVKTADNKNKILFNIK